MANRFSRQLKWIRDLSGLRDGISHTGEIRLPILSRREARVRYQAKFRKNTNYSSVQLLSYCYIEEFSAPSNVDFNLKLFNPFISNADSIVAACTQRIMDTNTDYSQWLVHD